MPIYTLHGCTIEVPKGRQSAKASRPEVRDDAGRVIQTAAAADFRTIAGGPTPEVQAQRWVLALPRLIEPRAPADNPAQTKDAQ
jgi:hypothetical protein